MATQRRFEQEIQRAAFQQPVRGAPRTFAFHPANGGWRSRVEAAIMKGFGVKAGVPDIIAIRDGRAFALELKAPGGRLTPAQLRCSRGAAYRRRRCGGNLRARRCARAARRMETPAESKEPVGK
jgi:hypothetical protein